MALRNDGTVLAWGDGLPSTPAPIKSLWLDGLYFNVFNGTFNISTTYLKITDRNNLTVRLTTDASSPVTWISRSPSAASVDANGNVKVDAPEEGKYDYTIIAAYTADGQYAYCRVDVEVPATDEYISRRNNRNMLQALFYDLSILFFGFLYWIFIGWWAR